MSEEKFVKVTNCVHNGLWTREGIGKIFKVKERDPKTYDVQDKRYYRYWIYKSECEEVTLKEVVMRNHTECTTREGNVYIVVGNRMYDENDDYLTLNEYNNDLTDTTYREFDIMKITYKDEVLWERQEKKRVEMPFMECLLEYKKDMETRHIECEYEGETLLFNDVNKMIWYKDMHPVTIDEILNGKWFLCER